ncbi:hypothetical protein C7212DRAFT_329105, partial [Tuber magnatum]
MKAPRNAFTVALPVLSSLGPVFGIGHANAVPVNNAVPNSPKYYFPRHVKRSVENTTIPASPPPPPPTGEASTTTVG